MIKLIDGSNVVTCVDIYITDYAIHTPIPPANRKVDQTIAGMEYVHGS